MITSTKKSYGSMITLASMLKEVGRKKAILMIYYVYPFVCLISRLELDIEENFDYNDLVELILDESTRVKLKEKALDSDTNGQGKNSQDHRDPDDPYVFIAGDFNSLPGDKTVGTHDDEAGSSRPKRTRVTETVKEAMLRRIHHEFLLWEIKVFEKGGQEEIFTSEACRRAFDIYEPIYTELGHEFYSTFEFDEVVTDEELITKKLIKFRGLRSDVHFNARDYWLSISSEDELHLSRSATQTIMSPLLKVLQKMITYGLCQRTTGSLDATNLRELIGSNGRLIVKDLAPGVLRVAMPRPSRLTMQDLYDMMGRIEIRQGTIERMSRSFFPPTTYNLFRLADQNGLKRRRKREMQGNTPIVPHS
uniref:DNAse I-like superfamily protein n=1 Tax=Tanacetum cinerariifolium TaxID=118510 RepID=A0A699GP80_TANCI|nr:DNAse I-like superfamily protein [Tanacetum cinerariifolium]